MKRTTARVLLVLGILAALGIAGSMFIAWRSVYMTEADPQVAGDAFDDVLAEFAGRQPIVARRDGTLVRRPYPESAQAKPTKLLALAYNARSAQLVRVDVGFWLVRMKGSAATGALARAGVDLKRLGLTVEDLERYGPSIVADERDGGNRLLVWTR